MSRSVVSKKQFTDHLEMACRVVRTWPEWKQGVLGGPVTSPPDKPFIDDFTLHVMKELKQICDCAEFYVQYKCRACKLWLEIKDHFQEINPDGTPIKY